MKNWKTTLSGILTVIPMVLHGLFPAVITLEAAAALSTFFAAVGLTASKDHNVTGAGK